MAEIADRDVELGSNEVLVERKIVARGGNGGSILAVVIMLAFIATCAVVFFGDRLGLRTPAPATVVVTPTTPTPAP